MSQILNLSLHTLPIEPVYRILDYLSPLDILLSMRNVCSRLDAITNTYQPYTVNIVTISHASWKSLISPRAYRGRRPCDLENELLSCEFYDEFCGVYAMPVNPFPSVLSTSNGI